MSEPFDNLDENQAASAVDAIALVAHDQRALPEGLRAIADEILDRKVGHVLTRIANEVESGKPLESISDQFAASMPAHFSGLIRNLENHSNLAVLSEAVSRHERYKNQMSKLKRAMFYPFTMLVICMLFAVFFGGNSVRSIEGVYQEFEIDTTGINQGLLWFNSIGAKIVLGFLIFVYSIYLFGKWILPHRSWERIVATLPLLGRVHYWAGLAELTGLLQLILRSERSLPETLKITASGLRNGMFRQAFLKMAERANDGLSLSQLFQGDCCFPNTLITFVSAPPESSTADRLESLSSIYWQMAMSRLEVLRVLLPVFAFCLAGAIICTLIFCVIVPITSLFRMMTMF